MLVTQKRSSARSHPERRQSNMCYTSAKTRILCMILVMALTVSAMVTPASAADTELYYQDILPAAGYTRFDDGVKASSDSVSPTYHFQEVTSAGWQWDARPYERTYRSFIITLRVSGNTVPSRVEFSHYTGRTVEAAFVSKHGEYLQYRVDYASNIAWVKVEGFFDKAFTGTFAIHSCIAIRDVGVNINTVSVSQRAYIINSSTINLEYKNVEVDQTHSLPYGHVSKRSKSTDWQYDAVDITVPYDVYSLDAASEVVFLFSGTCFLDGVNFQIMDDASTPLYIEPVVEWVCEANSVSVAGDHDRPIYYTQVKVDLSGYDLKDKDLRVAFQLDPAIYSDTYNSTDWYCESVIIRLPVEEVPWYKVFWNWVNVKWTSVTQSTHELIEDMTYKITMGLTVTKNQILIKLDDILGVLGGGEVSEELTQAGEAMSDQAEEMNQANDQLNSVDRPSVDSGELFGDMLNFNTGTLSILTAITEQPTVTKMLVVVFTFALCGYIFFGKK